MSLPGPTSNWRNSCATNTCKQRLDDPQLAAAVSKIEADNERREQADFTLTELEREKLGR